MSDVASGSHLPTASVPWARWFAPALLVVLIVDQVTKFWIFRTAQASLPPWLVHHNNTGVAWGIGNQMPLVVTLVTLVLLPLLTWVWWKQFRPYGAWENLAFGAVLGGALGNAVDRVLTQWGPLTGVRDFLVVDLHIIGIDYVWPTFNVADAGISGGVIILVLLSLFKRPAPASAGVQPAI